MEKKRKIRKIKSTTLKWQKLAGQLALSYCPKIYACKECGYPVIVGYCCETCGSNDPY